MGRNVIERREFLTALTAGLLSACGGKPEQATVQRLPEIPPLVQPTPTETRIAPKIEVITKSPRLIRWKEELSWRNPRARITISDFGDTTTEGKVEAEEGLKTRLVPDRFRGNHGPVWTWFYHSEHPEWNPGWNPEFTTLMEIDYYGDGRLVERWVVLTTIKRPQPKDDQNPADFPLFSAMRLKRFDSPEEEELISAQLPPPRSVYVWEPSGRIIHVRQT